MNKTVVTTDKAPAPIGPYNQAIKANGFLFETKPFSLGNIFSIKIPRGKNFNNLAVVFPTRY